MSSRDLSRRFRTLIVPAILVVLAPQTWAQEKADMPSTADSPTHHASAAQHEATAPPSPELEPAIPEGMTLDEVFEYAESPPPDDFPQTLHDDALFVFTQFEQLEYRAANDDDTRDHLGWEAQGWIGGVFSQY